VSEARALDQIRARLPHGCLPAVSPIVDDLYSLVVGGGRPGSVARRYNLLYVGAARLARSFELDDVLAALEDDMQYTVAIGARRKVFVNAGVVGWHGRALVVLGASGADTTSLVGALIRAGASYYADRFAVLDAHGRVHPFPTTRSIESLGNRVGREPLPVGAIVVFNHSRKARWRPRALTKGQAVLALLEHAVSAAKRPAFTLRVADAAVASANAVLRGTLGDENDIVTALLAATEGSMHAHLGGPPHATSHQEREPAGSRSRR
jgi:hypothetical protein